jgi:hypothetical protein
MRREDERRVVGLEYLGIYGYISLSVHLYFRYYENLSMMEGENVEMIPTYVCT